MLFKVVDDWKQNLHPDDELRLNEILRNVTKHRSAYRSSKDVKNAQLWAALLELDKKTSSMNYNMEKLEMIISGFADVIRRAEGVSERCGCDSKRTSCCDEKRISCCDERPRNSRDSKLIESLEKF